MLKESPEPGGNHRVVLADTVTVTRWWPARVFPGNKRVNAPAPLEDAWSRTETGGVMQNSDVRTGPGRESLTLFLGVVVEKPGRQTKASVRQIRKVWRTQEKVPDKDGGLSQNVSNVRKLGVSLGLSYSQFI